MIHLSPLDPEMPLDMMESDFENFYTPGALWPARARPREGKLVKAPLHCASAAVVGGASLVGVDIAKGR